VTHELDNGCQPWGAGSGQSAWSDYITITSGTLPVGIPVQLRTTFSLHATGSSSSHTSTKLWSDMVYLGPPGSPTATLPPGWSRYSYKMDYPTYSFTYNYIYSPDPSRPESASTPLVLDSTVHSLHSRFLSSILSLRGLCKSISSR
jgi:hypothetical protein